MKKDQLKLLLIVLFSVCILVVVGLIIYFVKAGSNTSNTTNTSSTKSPSTTSSTSNTSSSSTIESSPLTVTEGDIKFSLPAGWEYTKDNESGTYTFVNSASDTGVVKMRLSALGHGMFPKYELFKNDGLNLKVTPQEVGEETPVTETIKLSYMTYRTIPGGYTLLGVKYSDKNRYPTAVFITKYANGVFTSYTTASKVDEGGSTVTTIDTFPKLAGGDTMTDFEIVISGVTVKEDFTPVFDLLEGFITSLKN
jgi:hypothetical protein